MKIESEMTARTNAEAGKARSRFFIGTPPSPVMYALALLGLLVAVSATKVIDPDLWWHLSSGWAISQMQFIPKTDIFSYTAFGAPWLNNEWLFQVVAWLMYEHGGIGAITLLKFLLTASLAGVVFRTTRFLSGSPSIALWATAFMLVAASLRIMERPFLAALVLLGLFCHVLHRYAQGGGRLIWALPLIQVLWINVHGSGLQGPALACAFAAGETLLARIQAGWGGPEPIPAERRRRLWIAGFGCLAACTINPWGIDTLLFPFELIHMPAILDFTHEWIGFLHPWFDDVIPTHLMLASAFITLASFAANRGRARLSHLFLVAFMTSVLMRSARFGPDFMVVAIPIACANLASAFKGRFSTKPNGYRAAWIGLAAMTALSCLAAARGVTVTLGGGKLLEKGIGTLAEAAPTRMVDFLEANEIHGRVFNEMGLGGYLIFRRWPGERVFIDGRTPVYGDRFYEEFVDAFRTGRNFEKIERERRFDYMVFSGKDVWDQRYFHKYLWERPDWKLVYMAHDGIVYLRDTPKFRNKIEKLALETNPLMEMIRKDEEKNREKKMMSPPASAPSGTP